MWTYLYSTGQTTPFLYFLILILTDFQFIEHQDDLHCNLGSLNWIPLESVQSILCSQYVFPKLVLISALPHVFKAIHVIFFRDVICKIFKTIRGIFLNLNLKVTWLKVTPKLSKVKVVHVPKRHLTKPWIFTTKVPSSRIIIPHESASVGPGTSYITVATATQFQSLVSEYGSHCWRLDWRDWWCTSLHLHRLSTGFPTKLINYFIFRCSVYNFNFCIQMICLFRF